MCEEVNWSIDVLVELRVVDDKSHPYAVRFGNEEGGAAPIQCIVHWGDDPSVNQLLDCFGGFLFVTLWDSPCAQDLLRCSPRQKCNVHGFLRFHRFWVEIVIEDSGNCLLYTSPSPRD